MFDESSRVDRPPTTSSHTSNFTAGRPKAALLFRFFGEFRCGVLLLTIILII